MRFSAAPLAPGISKLTRRSPSCLLQRFSNLDFAVRPNGAVHQWRKDPPRKLSVGPGSGRDLMSVSCREKSWEGKFKARGLPLDQPRARPLEPAGVGDYTPRSGFPSPDCPGFYPEGVTR